MASRVLPQPVPPQTRVGRPWGSPPPVISSSPLIPVGHFNNCLLSSLCSFFSAIWKLFREVVKLLSFAEKRIAPWR